MTNYYTTTKKKSGSQLTAKVRGFVSNYQKLLAGISGFLFLSLLMFYIVQINAMTAEGFTQRQLDKEIKQLAESNQKLELQLVEARSMVNLRAKVETLNFVAANDIKYFANVNNSLAKR